MLSGIPTDPDTLDWKPLLMSWNTLRLRMNASTSNASPELIEAWRVGRYPETDIPEIRNLLRVLDEACRRAAIPHQVLPGARELIKGFHGRI